MSIDLAAHGALRMGALGNVLGGRQGAQRRMPMPGVVVVLEVFDHQSCFERAGRLSAVEALHS